MDLDETDRAILDQLQRSGRLSNAELAKHVHLSPPAVHTRTRRLEREGYIRGYAALLDPQRVGIEMVCFVHLTLQRHQPGEVGAISTAVCRMPEVLECHHVTGEHDFILKIAVRNRQDLERFIIEELTPIPGIARVHTGIVLREVKSTTVLPLAGPPHPSDRKARK